MPTTAPYELWQRTYNETPGALRWGPYTRVYTGRVYHDPGRPTAALDILFRTFNIDHPADFTGHSLSVGDIVVLDDIPFACQSRGWQRTIHPSEHAPGADHYFEDIA